MANQSQWQRCDKCGYSLRGIQSQHCPECGMPLNGVSFPISSPDQFHLARAALEREGLLLRAIDPGGAIGPVALANGFTNINGWLEVDASRLDRVAAILDGLGISNPVNARPIVDRTEPRCPQCAFSLDLAGPEICPKCNAPFMWVEIDESDFDEFA